MRGPAVLTGPRSSVHLDRFQGVRPHSHDGRECHVPFFVDEQRQGSCRQRQPVHLALEASREHAQAECPAGTAKDAHDPRRWLALVGKEVVLVSDHPAPTFSSEPDGQAEPSGGILC